MREIPPKCYSREYFLFKDKSKDFKRFKKGGHPGRIFLQALKYVPKDIVGPFLDVGCGRGEMVVYLARLGKRAYGIDYSQEAVRFSQGILKSEKKTVQNLASFQLADCTQLPFKKNTFQCLFLLDIVEHLTPKQLKLTLKEANRVLKEQGVLVIHTNNKYFEKIAKLFIAASYHGIKIKLLLRPYDDLHINYLTGGELVDYLRKNGFRAKIEYVKPKRKTELQKSIPYSEGWKRCLVYNVAWLLLNSPLIKFVSPTFWVIARKIK